MGLRNPFAPVSRIGALALCLVVSLSCATGGSKQSKAEQEADKRQAVAHYNLGIHHMTQGNTALSIRELRAAVEKDPSDAWIHLALAEAYRLKGKLAECESHLKQSLALSPDFQNARLTLSALYIQTGRYAEAVPEAERLVDDPSFPAPWRAHTNLGSALFKLGRISEARQHLELALEYRPFYLTALLDLAVLEAEAGNKLKAIGLLTQVLEYEPGAMVESEANFRLGEAYVSLGKREDALVYLSKAKASRPGGPWAKRSEEYLKLLQ
jgi:type IV pilus assembly protein PilF